MEAEKPIFRPDHQLEDYLRRTMVNREDFERYYPAGNSSGNAKKSSEETVDYLIVTNEDLRNAFQPLLDWKMRKGLRSQIVTLESIDQAYSNPNIQLKIKQYLFDQYRDHDLKYVLLGGDADIIPVQGCYSSVHSGLELLEDYNVPTDLFYACFDGRFDWNSVVDDKIGQIHWDGHELVPDIYLSRLPLKTYSQVEDFVTKTLKYEQEPPLESFFGRMLLTGVQNLQSWEGRSDSHHRSLNFNSSILKNYWSGRPIEFYDTGTDFPGGSKFEVTSDNLVDQLNAGYGFFNFSGNGSSQFLVMEEGRVFSTVDAYLLKNPHPGIVVSNSRSFNAFENGDPSLPEAFIRNPKGGAVAFFGSSRLAFDNPDSTDELGPSFAFNASFFNYLFNEKLAPEWKSFARVSAMAKTEYIYTGTSGGAYLYLLYAVNPVGDPELPVFTEDPMLFENVRIYRFGDQLIVNTGGISNSRICMTSLDLAEGVQELAEGVSYHTFESVPASFQITITAPGYKPYIYTTTLSSVQVSGQDRFANVYPVPATIQLILDLPKAAECHLKDLNGKLLREISLEGGRHSMDISTLLPGIYFIHVLTDSGSKILKFIKI